MDFEQEMYLKYAAQAPDLWHEERCVFNVKDTELYHVDIMPLIFTYALVLTPKAGVDYYVDRWCYHTLEAAVDAAVEWDATGWVKAAMSDSSPALCEPEGWHRHPLSDRRRNQPQHRKEGATL